MKIPKSTFQSLWKLYSSQGWLADREQQLLESLDLCQSIQEQNLLTELLFRFVHVDAKEFNKKLTSLAQLICETWCLDKTKVQLVATTADHNPDSAQLMLQVLKPFLLKHDWGKVKINNLFTRSFRDLEKFPIVVLVDEFSGTGETIRSRLRSLKNEVANREKQTGTKIDLKVYVAVLAAIENTKATVRPDCDAYVAQIWLKKGISGSFENIALVEATEAMERLESLLKQDFPDYDFPSFGYGRAEALYSLENSNTPNSVFPIFWWRHLKDGTQWNPLLNRQDPNLP